MGLVLFTMIIAAPALAIVIVVVFVRAFRKGGRTWRSAGHALAKTVLVAAVLIALYVTPVALPAGYNKAADWMAGPSLAPVTLVKELLGFYPVKVTIEAVVEDKPVKVERVFECYRKITLHEGCFLCSQWKASFYSISHKLESGNWLLGQFPSNCGNKDFGTQPDVLSNSTFAWTDNPRQPKFLEKYNPDASIFSDFVAVSPKIVRRSISINFQRYIMGEIQPDDPKLQSILYGPSVWGSGLSHDIPTQPYYMGWGWVVPIPKVVWSKLDFLQKRLTGILETEIVHVSVQEQNKIFNVISGALKNVKKNLVLENVKEIDFTDLPIHVPLRPKSVGVWELDQGRSGISVHHFIGQLDDEKESKVKPINFKLEEKWVERQQLFYRGKLYPFILESPTSPQKFLFDPSSSSLLMLPRRIYIDPINSLPTQTR